MFQKYFNFKRFYYTFKYDLMLNLKSYLSFGISLFLGLILIDFLFILNAGWKFDQNIYLPLFYFSFLISSILVIGTSFPLLRNKKSIAHYLILPASTFEKILIQFIIRIGLFIPFFLIVFWLDLKLAGGIYNLFDWPNITQIESFTLLEPFESLPFRNTLDILALVGVILTVATFLFTGATYFKKYALFKTVLSFSILIGSVILLFWGFTMIFYPDFYKTGGTFIYLKPYKISEHMFNIQLFFYVIAIVSSLFLLPLAYFKLKEKQL